MFSPALASTETVMHDYARFYAPDRLARLGLGFGLGMLAANTNIDSHVQTWYQQDVRHLRTDAVSRSVKFFGEGKYFIPLSLLLAGFAYVDPDASIAAWGAYSTRAYLAGGPAMLFLQRATGGSRPEETAHDAHWRPFRDDNGVSGHAFMGAIPFLTLGKMMREQAFLKYCAYAASAATAWSRINDNKHYLSQAVLGWYLAWESVDAVFEAEGQRESISVAPIMSRNRYGITVHFTW